MLGFLRCLNDLSVVLNDAHSTGTDKHGGNIGRFGALDGLIVGRSGRGKGLDRQKNPHNVIRGEFAKPGQTDWAVLCSVKGVSTILVFWNGSEKNPAEIAKLEDQIFLQGITADEIGFSRGISAVGNEFIMEHYQAYGGPKPPPINHQGINDAFLEKGSEVQYFYGGKWVKLTGAD